MSGESDNELMIVEEDEGTAPGPSKKGTGDAAENNKSIVIPAIVNKKKMEGNQKDDTNTPW